MRVCVVIQALCLLFIAVEAVTSTPPCLPLSEYLWQETSQEHKDALNSTYIQGLKTASMNPTAFGAYMVQDAVYCYKVKMIVDIAADKATDPALKQLFKTTSKSWESYYKYLFEEWHINDPNGISLGDACSSYINHYNDVATSMDSVYFVTALIPCYKLWPWLGGQIGAKTESFGVYTQWVKDYLDPDYQGFDKFENVINYANMAGHIDIQKALKVYSRSMRGEVAFFSSVPGPDNGVSPLTHVK